MTGQPHDDVPTAPGTATELPTGPSDPELIKAARAGETSPFGELYARHRGAVLRLARVLVSSQPSSSEPPASTPSDIDRQATHASDEAAAEELVEETFAGIRTSLQAGNGPDLAFRGYALASLRDVHVDRVRRSQTPGSADGQAGSLAADVPDTVARRAFAGLPERWQMALWHIDVDGEGPEHVGALLGMSPAAVDTLTHRAGQRLRERYAAELPHDSADAGCHRAMASLTGVADDEDTRYAKSHMSSCDPCRVAHGELAALRADRAGVLAHAVLGDAATAYLGRTHRQEPSAASRRLARWGATVRRGAERVGPRRAAAGAAIAATAGILTAVMLAALAVKPPAQPPAAAPLPSDTPADTAPSSQSPAPTATGTPSTSPSGSASATASPGSTPASPGSTPASPGAPAPPGPPAPVPTPRLQITSAGQQGDLVAGQPGALAVAVRNSGNGAAAPVRLGVHLPRDFSLAGNSAGDGWQCTASPWGATCTRVLLPAGGSSTAVVRVAVDRRASGSPTVTVTVESGPTRDVDTFTVEVQKNRGGDVPAG